MRIYIYRAEEASEASTSRKRNENDTSGHKPDFRLKLWELGLEILFMETSRPKADVKKFVDDWWKLVRMMKDGRDRMVDEIAADVCLHDLPIFAIHIHELRLRITMEDMPYGAYYRALELESFEIPLEPPKIADSLKDVVCKLMRLREYVNQVALCILEINNAMGERPQDSSHNNTITPSSPSKNSIMSMSFDT